MEQIYTKFTVSSNQLQQLNEVNKLEGDFENKPLKRFFSHCRDSMEFKDRQKHFKKFFSGLGYNLEKIGNAEIKDYFLNLALGTNSFLPKKFQTDDILSGFAYYLAKNYWGLEDGYEELKFTAIKKFDDGVVWYFFDPAFKIFLGEMAMSKSPVLPKRSMKIDTVVIEEQFRGIRYGIKMYLTVLAHLDYLQSDRTLYSGAFKLWTNGLPQYSTVWYAKEYPIIKKTQTDYKKVKEDTILYPDNVDYFVASTKYNKL